MTTLADLLRDARKRLKLTQQDVADRLGVSRQAVTHWEQGRGIDLGHLVRMAGILEIDVGHALSLAGMTIPAEALPGFGEERREFGASRSKKAISIEVDGALLDRARAEGIDLNKLVQDTLTQTLLALGRQRWEAENKLALAAYNERVRENGPAGAEYSRYG